MVPPKANALNPVPAASYPSNTKFFETRGVEWKKRQ